MASLIKQIKKNVKRLDETLAVLTKYLDAQQQEVKYPLAIPHQYSLEADVANETKVRADLKRKARNKRKSKKK